MKKRDDGEDPRFSYALEYVRGLRRQARFPTELIDAVQDGLIDLLQRRRDLGQSREGVFALGRRQLDWRIKDWQRKRMEPDGRIRSHPSAAGSLDQRKLSVNGEGGRLYDSIADESCLDPERIFLAREEFAEMIDRAREDGLNTLRMVLAEISGMTPQELASSLGVEVNTVHQWRSRYRARRRKGSK